MSSATDFHAALSYLEDSSIATEPQRFYRRGRTGHIHYDQYCFKPRAQTTPVMMSLVEATSRQVCTACFAKAFRSGPLRTVAELRKHHNDLEFARTALASGQPASVNHAWDASRAALQALEKIDADGCVPAHAALVESAKALVSAAHARLGAAADDVLRMVAADLVTISLGKGESNFSHGFRYTIPVSDPTATVRAGKALTPNVNVLESTLEAAYLVWQAARAAGDEGAAGKARDLIAERATLTDLEQLTGVSLAVATETDASTLLHSAWRARVNADIDRLSAAWEESFAANLAARESRSAGVRLKRWGISDETLSVLRAFPHVERGQVLTGTYPQVVLWWLLGELGSEYVEVADRALDVPSLETAAVLWDPTSSHGAYPTFRAALDASVALA